MFTSPVSRMIKMDFPTPTIPNTSGLILLFLCALALIGYFLLIYTTGSARREFLLETRVRYFRGWTIVNLCILLLTYLALDYLSFNTATVLIAIVCMFFIGYGLYLPKLFIGWEDPKIPQEYKGAVITNPSWFSLWFYFSSGLFNSVVSLLTLILIFKWAFFGFVIEGIHAFDILLLVNAIFILGDLGNLKKKLKWSSKKHVNQLKSC